MLCRIPAGRHGPAVFIAIVTLLVSGAAGAAGERSSSPMVNLTVGRVGIDHGLHSSGHYGFEYRMRPVGRYRLVPAIGFAQAENEASFAYAELKRDFRFASGVIVTPSLGLGRFDESAELTLGQALEFRSGLEIAYELPNRRRLGLALYHISNGGLGPVNPGSEALVVSFSLPAD